MANKPVRINTPVGVANYPHLTKPDTKFVKPHGEYKTKLVCSREESEALIEQLEEIRDAYVAEQLAEDPKKKKWAIADVAEDALNDEGDETGDVVFNAKLKRHVETKDGKEWDQEPAIYDSANAQVEDITKLKLWGGSRVRLNCDVIPYAMASTKTFGVSLRLRAVQIVELSAGNAGASPFDTYEGGEEFADEPPTDSPFDGAAGSDAGDDDDDF